MRKRKPVIAFDFGDKDLEFDSIQTASKELQIGTDKLLRGINKGKPVATGMGDLFLDFKIEGYDGGKERR
jgi:hypothetical protein